MLKKTTVTGDCVKLGTSLNAQIGSGEFDLLPWLCMNETLPGS